MGSRAVNGLEGTVQADGKAGSNAAIGGSEQI